MKTIPRLSIIAAVLISSLAAITAFAADAPKMTMTTDIPREIITPDSVETSIGTLRFLDGAPYPETAKNAYAFLDTMRGVDAFIKGMLGSATCRTSDRPDPMKARAANILYFFRAAGVTRPMATSWFSPGLTPSGSSCAAP